MKELKEIEEMTLDDLLQVADDESVSAPDVLKKRLQNLILASTLSKQIPNPADASVPVMGADEVALQTLLFLMPLPAHPGTLLLQHGD